MLEKIGLPPKPAGRGRIWVVDASHCQQCASAFSFFNRKHHCRRCGGLFCGNCVQSRMYLRGQGDAPVRICEPCKKLEEAARFEARHGRKKKDESSNESDDILLKSLLNDEGPSSSHSIAPDPVTPESLRQHAQEMKAKWIALKKEGKNEDALKAFKRSRELERQADALVLALRKAARSNKETETTKKQPEKTEVTQPKEKSTVDEKQDLMNELKELGWSEADEVKQASDTDILNEGATKSKKATEELQQQIQGHKRKALALKRDGDLSGAKEELKKAKTLEKRLEDMQVLGEDFEDEEEDGDELTTILRALEKEVNIKEVHEVKYSGNSNLTIPTVNEEDETLMDVDDADLTDPEMIKTLKDMGWTEDEHIPMDRDEIQKNILAHKRQALAFKRAGKLAEARKELNEVKTLEKLLEEDEVTDQDMQDPEILAALRAFGDDSQQHKLVEENKDEIAYKRPATFDEDEDVTKHIRDFSKDPELATIFKGFNFDHKIDEEVVSVPNKDVRPPKALTPPMKVPRELPQRSKLEIQKDLLAKKRQALALRREGKTAEADKLLDESRVLESQLKAFETAPVHIQQVPEEDGDGESDEVTEDDMNDPVMLAALKAMGFTEEAVRQPASGHTAKYTVVEPGHTVSTAHVHIVQEPAQPIVQRDPSAHMRDDTVQAPTKHRDENLSRVTRSSEIQQDILEHKRKALALKRNGDLAGAKEELKKVKALEKELQGEESSDIPGTSQPKPQQDQRIPTKPPQQEQPSASKSSHEQAIPGKSQQEQAVPKKAQREQARPRDRMKLQQESLAHKRKALALRREGKIDEAEKEFEIAKSFEKQMEEMEGSSQQGLASNDDVTVEDVMDPQLMAALAGIGLDIGGKASKNVQVDKGKGQTIMQDKCKGQTIMQDKCKGQNVQEKGKGQDLQEKIRALKLRAVELRRAGRQQEALEALREAKKLERL